MSASDRPPRMPHVPWARRWIVGWPKLVAAGLAVASMVAAKYDHFSAAQWLIGSSMLLGLWGWWLLRRADRRLADQVRLGLHCICGYDLRATPDRCPECGRVPQRTANMPNQTTTQ